MTRSNPVNVAEGMALDEHAAHPRNLPGLEILDEAPSTVASVSTMPRSGN